MAESSFRPEACLAFESYRDTKLSQVLKARLGDRERTLLNSDGVMSSQGHLMVWFRREYSVIQATI